MLTRKQSFISIALTLTTLVMLSAWPAIAEAQRRPVHRPGGRSVVFIGGWGNPYSPLFYDPWFQYPGRYPYPYPYPPYGYYGGRDELTSSVKLEVSPRQAEVFVDGYRAGLVDDFDGFLQRLRLRPGEHDLTIYLAGYRTVHERLYLNPGTDRKMTLAMTPLGAGESLEARPEPPAAPPPQARPAEPMPPPRARAPEPERARFGTVSIRVVPANAEVLIDGERWRIQNALEPLMIQLSEGRHRIDVRRNNYETYSTDVDIRVGETTTLNISLKRIGS